VPQPAPTPVPKRAATRSAARQRMLIALAAAVALTGGLLASGAAAPMVMDVVALTTGPSDSPGASPPVGRTLNGTKVALSDSTTDWMASDPRPEWGQQRLVPQGPTGQDRAQTPVSPEQPQIQVPENPKGRHLFAYGQAMRRYTLRPPPDCPQAHGPGLRVQVILAESTTPGSASVSWWDLGDPLEISYQVDAFPVGGVMMLSDAPRIQAKSMIIKVKAPNTCRRVRVNFRGLVSGQKYTFILTGSAISPQQGNRVVRDGRGETSAIVVA
jgi:hypothetical protein